MNTQDKPSGSLSLSHIKGIDSIRFICALWVLFGHLGGFPLVVDADLHSFIGKAAKGLYGLFYNGPAAVIIFFIVSGFCIHFPYRDLKRVPIAAFYARRYIRIGVPVVVAMLLAAWLGVSSLIIQPTSLVILPHSVRMVEDSDNGVIWSLVCELIYYSLYPLLFKVIRKWGWKITLGLAYGLALGVILIRPGGQSYPAYGNLLTWIVGLPCWLLGCYLADTFKYSEHEKISLTKIWLWRLAIWTISSVFLALRFHSSIGFPWTLTLFAVLGLQWLRAEIIFNSANKTSSLFEWGGKWSYSIYLGHVLALPFFVRIGLPLNFSSAGPILSWCFGTLAVLAFCWLFYIIVEFPSHRVARVVSRKVAQHTII